MELLKEEDMVLTLPPPVKVFGALQGQIWDLLSHFKWFQAPVEEGDLAHLGAPGIYHTLYILHDIHNMVYTRI